MVQEEAGLLALPEVPHQRHPVLPDPHPAPGDLAEAQHRALAAPAIAALPTEPPSNDPDVVPTAVVPFPEALLAGTQLNKGFGHQVALIPNFFPDGRAVVAVSALIQDIGTVKNAGAVTFHGFDFATGGLDAKPVGLMVGETFRPNGHLGALLQSGVHNGVNVLLVGASLGVAYGDESSVDNGTLYVVPIPSAQE